MQAVKMARLSDLPRETDYGKAGAGINNFEIDGISIGAPVPSPPSVFVYSITGIENSPPSLMPDGQREVMVFVRV